MKFDNILLTTDFSEDSVKAFDLSSYEVKMEGSKITLLYVFEEWVVPPTIRAKFPNPTAIDEYTEELYQNCVEKLQEYAEKYFHGLNVQVVVVKTKDTVAEEITRYAKDNKYNVIVISSHGRGAVGRIVLGSVVEKVIKMSSCPVLVIPRHEDS